VTDERDDERLAAIRDDDAPDPAGAGDTSGMPLGPWRHVSGRFSPAQRSLIIGGVLVVAALAVYALVTPSLASYRSAKPGACFTGSESVAAGAAAGKVRAVSGSPSGQTVPCDQPHVQEVMGQADLPGDRGAAFDPDAVPAAAVSACTGLFATYVGRSLDGSSLGATAYYPDRQEWTDANERTVVCMVSDPSAKTITTSLKGSAR
jgi:Septum formation